MKLEFPRQFSKKYQFTPCGRVEGRMDRNDEDNSRFLQFCESA